MDNIPENWPQETHVSRETLAKLHQYQKQLHKWQKTINLVSPATLHESWERHFLDSLQLLPFVPEDTKVIADLGSGAGFPGLVLAICRPNTAVHLVESDTRKGSFLRHIKTQLQMDNCFLHSQRIEDVQDIKADIVTARALAPLEQLIAWGRNYLNTDNPKSFCLFPKGRSFQDEIDALQSSYPTQSPSWTVETHKSLIEPEAALVLIHGIRN